MGSTPIHNIPFAEPTDLVRDWPALSEDVALAIEAALEDISVPQKRIEAFTGSGTWTVPAGVTFAIAHMLGGGGAVGPSNPGTTGATSSVAFSSGTVSALGGRGGATSASQMRVNPVAGSANSGGGGATSGDGSSISGTHGTAAGDAQWIVAGASVTPAASITVTVGAGGSGSADGGSGYVYIEYFEEV